MKEVKAYKITKGDKSVEFITHKFVKLEDPDNCDNYIYCFDNLSTEEMDKLARDLNENDIPFVTYPKTSTWKICVKESEIDILTVTAPNYNLCSRRQLIRIIKQKDEIINSLCN